MSVYLAWGAYTFQIDISRLRFYVSSVRNGKMELYVILYTRVNQWENPWLLTPDHKFTSHLKYRRHFVEYPIEYPIHQPLNCRGLPEINTDMSNDKIVMEIIVSQGCV